MDVLGLLVVTCVSFSIRCIPSEDDNVLRELARCIKAADMSDLQIQVSTEHFDPESLKNRTFLWHGWTAVFLQGKCCY